MQEETIGYLSDRSSGGLLVVDSRCGWISGVRPIIGGEDGFAQYFCCVPIWDSGVMTSRGSSSVLSSCSGASAKA